jgi:hypothetical protein
LIYCKAWHGVELRSIVDNDISDSVFLIALIFLLALIALFALITLIALIALPFLPTSLLTFLPTFLPASFISFLIYIALCIRILFSSGFGGSFSSSLFLI